MASKSPKKKGKLLPSQERLLDALEIEKAAASTTRPVAKMYLEVLARTVREQSDALKAKEAAKKKKGSPRKAAKKGQATDQQVVAPTTQQEHHQAPRASTCRSYVHNRNERWHHRYQELCEFKRIHGHCKVPATHVNKYVKDEQQKRLGNWVGNQRKQYKQGTLPEDRKALLEEIGFCWVVHTIRQPPNTEFIDAKFRTNLKKLMDYKERFGDCRVPQHYAQDPSLANWVHRMRQLKVEKTLKPERIVMLEDLGFVWRASNVPRNKSSPSKKTPSQQKANHSNPDPSVD